MSQKIYTDLDIKGNTTIGSIANATTDTDKFLVSDNGLVKYRTGAEMLSDLGVAPGVASNVQHQVKAEVAINKGQAVYVTSADGTNMIVGLASNTSEATSSKTMGLLDSTVAINGFANVITEGLLAGLNTIGATAGDPVWLGTDGNLIYGLINKPSAPAHLVFIGIVTRVNASNGEIFVKVQNGFELNEIHDVDLKTTTPVNGDILGFNGTLWVNKTIAAWLGYTPANASGTTNYVSKFTGSGTLGNSQIFDNGTNIGIGTTNPSTNLHILGDSFSVNPSVRITHNPGSSPEFIELLAGAFDGGGIVSVGSTSSMIFKRGSNESMRINGSGNVGIGTSSPTTKLHVIGDVYTSTGYIAAGNSYMNSIGNTSTNNNANLSLTTSGVRTSRNIADSNTVFAVINQNASSTGPIQTWNNSGGELMRVAQNGNVGIGTSTPSTLLDVNGIITAIGGNSTQWNSKQENLVSGTNIKTVNGNSILGSGNLSAKGVHTLVKPAVGQSTSFGLTAANVSTTSSFALRLIVVPYIPANTITCSSLYINIASSSAGANARILIYSDNDGTPGTKIYESTNLDCSTTGIKSAITTQTFVAGTTYWIGTHSSAVFTYSSYTAATLLPIIVNQTAQVTQFYTTAAFGSAPSTFGTPLTSALPVPMVGITI